MKEQILQLIVRPMEDCPIRPHHKGLLYHGAFGVGKTSMMDATVNLSTKIRFIKLDSTKLGIEAPGNECAYFTRLFQKARELRPCIILVDEIDAILRANDTSESIVVFNQCWKALNECGIAVIATTNYKERLNENSLNLFTIKQVVVKPDEETRESFFRKMQEGEPNDLPLPLEIAKATEGADFRQLNAPHLWMNNPVRKVTPKQIEQEFRNM